MRTGASTCNPSPLLHRSSLLRHHSSRLSSLSSRVGTQRIHLHPSTSLGPCQAQRPSSSSSRGGGKRGGSSNGGLDNVDKLLSEQPELRVGGQNNAAKGHNRASAPFKTGKSSKPTFLESLDTIELAASPSPDATADMLYHLGNALNREAKHRQLGSVEQARLAAAMAKLSELLLEVYSRNSKRIEQLDGKHLSLSAWGMGKVGSMGMQVSTRLGIAFAACALACPFMDGPGARGKGWLNWANLLYGLAEAGMVCSTSRHVHAAFDAAVNDRLLAERQVYNGQDVGNTFHATASAGYAGDLEPLVSTVAEDLSKVMKGATAQAWSNTVWALAKHEEMKAGRLGQGVLAILNEGVAAMAGLAHCGKASPQELSNVLWALPKLGWTGDVAILNELVSALASKASHAAPQALSNVLWAIAKLGWKGDMRVVGELASGLVKKARNTEPQELANTLWALSELGWFDASTYSTLLSTLQIKFGGAKPQEISSALLACAEAQHWDRNVEQLAEFISKQSAQQWGQWEAQAIANALYSWAVLTAVGSTPASPSSTRMAQHLFKQAARRGASDFTDISLIQLFIAHEVAVHEEVAGGGLSAHQELLKAASIARLSSLRSLQKRAKRPSRIETEVVAALQHAGYEVERAVLVGSMFVQLQAQGVAVRVAVADEYFRSPPSLLKGSFAVHSVLYSWVCAGSMVISEAGWANLQGDPQQQQAFVIQRLQQALSKA